MLSLQQGREKSKKEKKGSKGHKKVRRKGNLLQKLMVMADDDEAPKGFARRVRQGTVMIVHRRLHRTLGFDEGAPKRSRIGIVVLREMD